MKTKSNLEGKYTVEHINLRDLIILYSLFITGSIISLYFRVNYLTNILLFTLLPVAFLLFKLRKFIKKYLLESLLLSIPASIIIDTLGHYNNAWFETTILPFKVFGQMPIEGFLWGYMFVLIIILFYDYFFDKYSSTKFTKYSLYLLELLYAGLVTFCIIFYFNASLFKMPLFYLFLMVGMTVMFVLIGKFYPYLVHKTFLTTWYLFPISLLWEFTALELELWGFLPGEHIGYIQILTKYVMPIEELIWFVIVVMNVIIIHEVFMDNKK